MQRLPHIFFAASPLGGRGVFTSEFIPAIIHQTDLHDYYFLWGEDEKQCAIALGFGSLYNHAYDANAEYILDLDDNTIDFYSVKDIEPGTEITVNYNGWPDDPAPVWFDQPDYKR